MRTILEFLAKGLNIPTVEAMALRLLGVVLVLVATFLLTSASRRYLKRRWKADATDQMALRLHSGFILIAGWGVGGMIALQTLGLNLSHLFTAGGLLAVAVAFAMKNLAENIVSGVILRLEGEIEPGDILYTGGDVVEVKAIGFRTTIVRTKDEAERVIPNSQLVQESIDNNTYADRLYRLTTSVGVSYDSDMRTVKETLTAVCDRLDWKATSKTPEVRLLEFGDSSVVFQTLVWMDDPWNADRRRAELNEAIWWALKKAGIVIAFPQLDVHLGNGGATPTAPAPRSV